MGAQPASAGARTPVPRSPSPTHPCMRPALLCVQIEYVLKKAGAKGQMAIIGFLVLLLIILIFLLVG